jgi:hypothetical protein
VEAQSPRVVWEAVNAQSVLAVATKEQERVSAGVNAQPVLAVAAKERERDSAAVRQQARN